MMTIKKITVKSFFIQTAINSENRRCGNQKIFT